MGRAELRRQAKSRKKEQEKTTKVLRNKGTEKLPFFLKWKFFFYIFLIFYSKKHKKLWFTP